MKSNGLKNDEKIIQYSERKDQMEKLPDHLDGYSTLFMFNQLDQTFDWNNLFNLWRAHELSYKTLPSKSEKIKHASWAAAQNQVVQQLEGPSKKFRNQLRNLFSETPADKPKIVERLDAAFNYFFPTLDQVYFSNLKKIGEMSRLPKTKQFVDELKDLES